MFIKDRNSFCVLHNIRTSRELELGFEADMNTRGASCGIFLDFWPVAMAIQETPKNDASLPPQIEQQSDNKSPQIQCRGRRMTTIHAMYIPPPLWG